MNPSELQRSKSMYLVVPALIGLFVAGVVVGSLFCVSEDPYFRNNVSRCLLEIQWAIERGDSSSVVSAIDGRFEYYILADPFAVAEIVTNLQNAKRSPTPKSGSPTDEPNEDENILPGKQ
jgi:hypothetical protein